jgi:preprotein translocase subunit YajC
MRSILLQAPGGEGAFPQIILFLGIGLVVYFFMIRPQQKKQKDQKKFIEELKKGDRVVTIGGIHGKVFSIEDGTVVLEIDRGNKITFEKSAISLDNSKKEKKA